MDEIAGWNYRISERLNSGQAGRLYKSGSRSLETLGRPVLLEVFLAFLPHFKLIVS
jgi:hypothetical protein